MSSLTFATLSTHPNDILDFTSLTWDEFCELLEPFDTAFHERMSTWRLDGKPRTKRAYTTYQNCPLPTPEDRLLFILSYLKSNALQVFHGRLFGMRQNKANQWIHILLPVLRSTLATLGDTPSRNLTDLAQRLGVSLATLEANLTDTDESLPLPPATPATDPAGADESRCPSAPPPPSAPFFCHDGTERPIPRPTHADAQKDCSSGKKKRHTVKNIVLINAVLTIVFLSPTAPGKRHDKRIADETPYPLPSGSTLLQDRGFLAFALPNVDTQTPIRKPRGKELTEEQKASNQALARRRVRIEHVNSSVKRCRILKDSCRMHTAEMRDMVMEIGCALHNFRLRITPSWQPMT